VAMRPVVAGSPRPSPGNRLESRSDTFCHALRACLRRRLHAPSRVREKADRERLNPYRDSRAESRKRGNRAVLGACAGRAGEGTMGLGSFRSPQTSPANTCGRASCVRQFQPSGMLQP
jgi:hypothetical protein